jgi:hypothetical protein
LIPFSGIQFYSTSFDRDASGAFNREFYVTSETTRTGTEEEVRAKITPAWEDDNPDAEIAPPDVKYETVSVSKLRAYEAFIGNWIPVPFFRALPGDSLRRSNLDTGPTNWVRVLVTPQEGAGAPGGPVRFDVVYAFDTNLSQFNDGDPHYLSPTESDILHEKTFRFAFKTQQAIRFLNNPQEFEHDGEIVHHDIQEWASQWIQRAFERHKLVQPQRRGRAPDEKERHSWSIESSCRYLAFLQLLAQSAPPPDISFVDTLSANQEFRRRHAGVADKSPQHVDVSLVLDIGNSRTCGILVETFPTALRKAELKDAMLLRLRDLSRPHLTYRDPFESHVELTQPQFGPVDLSELSGRADAFIWPSIVRIGPEAIRIRDQAVGTEALSGLTSPKRYLYDVPALNQEWRFNSANESSGPSEQLDTLVRNHVGPRGDVRRQINADKGERALYKRLTYNYEKVDISAYPQRLSFSRSSMFTFMLAEIVWQAFCMINNPQVRAERAESDTPRRLARVILTVPTAMSVSEQQILRSRARAAIKLLWDLLGWVDQPPPNVIEPQVEIFIDEASCAQFVYLYSEIARHFLGNANEYFDLVGQRRVRPSAKGNVQSVTAGEPSLRIASIDIGGGTTDLMITTYFVEDGKALVPVQNYREGFRIAGDDLLRDIVERCVLPAIENRLTECGLRNSRAFLNFRFGIDRVDMSEPDRYLRRQCVLRILRPTAIAIIHAVEKQDWAAEAPPIKSSIRELVIGSGSSVDDPAALRAIHYVDHAAHQEGADEFNILDTEISILLPTVRAAVEEIFGNAFDNLAEIINHLDCDLVLLAGRPSRLPPVVDLLVNKMPVPPDRITAMSSFQVGSWYPFASPNDFTISDPKTVTVTGAMLALFAQRDIENFTIFVDRLAHRSCARQIGVLTANDRLRNADVKFDFDPNRPAGIQENAKLNYHAPLYLGYRQIPYDRWIATPLYFLRMVGGESTRNIARPVEIVLARESPEELEDLNSAQLPTSEALKEFIRIEEATDARGALVTPSFVLELNTMGSLGGYWLDTGLLTVR